MLRQEMNIGYFGMIHRPGEKLGVFDNGSDFERCVERTHCNCTHGFFGPSVIWNEEKQEYTLKEDALEEQLQSFRDVIKGRRHTILGGGEHNNVYFPGFYHYRKNIPEALMQDEDGNYLELRDPDILDGKPIPMPAIDDPGLLKLYARQQARQASFMPGCHHVAAYVMGAEMLYPEYFGLGHGDYRPVSWAHFAAWCAKQGCDQPSKEETLQEGSAARRLWLRFREQAMADRAAYYYRAILSEDVTHLCYYPTHGSALHGDARSRLGQQPDTLSSACDGIEMGHILIDDDAERRNVIMTCLNTSYGTPVIVPRLGNKTPDLSAGGGGRSFTPETLRRLVYEDVGMGISIIFPIHWRSHLHDGEWFIKDTPAEAECRKVFDEIITAAPYMNGLGRMQPALGVLAADDTWLEKWQMRWTALMQDALNDSIHATIMTDALLEKGLARRMPVLLLMDDATLCDKTLQRLIDYLEEGGKLVLWGEFAVGGSPALKQRVLSHPGCLTSQAPVEDRPRKIREMFLTGMRDGVCGTRYSFHAVDYSRLMQEIEAFAPSAILRPFKLTGQVKDVNCYPLTDRCGMGCVFINNGGEERLLTATPDERLIKNACAVDMLTGQAVTFPIKLPGHGTRLLYFAPSMTPEEQEDTICDAEDVYERWQQAQANVDALRHYYSNMRSGPHLLKRYALADALLHSIALRSSYEVASDGALTVFVQALGPDGAPVADADISMRIVPGERRRYAFQPDGKGGYVCRVAKEELPVAYDPDHCDYLPLKGAARLILQAEASTLQGGSLMNIHL